MTGSSLNFAALADFAEFPGFTEFAAFALEQLKPQPLKEMDIVHKSDAP
jgi:hypothetical protein